MTLVHTLGLWTGKSLVCVRWTLALSCALFLLLAAPAHAQSYLALYEFQCVTSTLSTEGCLPVDTGQLTLWSDLSLYGTASSGSAYYEPGCGTIFNVTTSAAYSDVYSFDSDATVVSDRQCYPFAALTPAVNPKTLVTYLYGATSYIGVVRPTLFRYDPGSGTMTVLHYPVPKGDDLRDPPVVGKDGNLYGLNFQGVPYQINAQTNAVTEFSSSAAGWNGGPLFLANDGKLYGETCGDFASNNTLFTMTTAGVITPFYTFSTPDCPSGGLTQLKGTSGNVLYGVASSGGLNGEGYVFQIATDGTGFGDMHDFDALSATNTNADGASPIAGLLAAADGNLYGTASGGGVNGYGTIFEFVPSGSSWTFFKIFDFSGTSGSVLGAYPTSALMEYPDGSLYGVTESGGISGGLGPTVDGAGVVYKVTPFNPFSTVTLCCNTFVILDQPVQIIGIGIDEVEAVSFAGAPAQFQQVSSSYVTAQVPAAAVDGQVTITAITPSGGEVQVSSQQTLHILPDITTLRPAHGAVGSQVLVEGGGFANASEVAFNGVPATVFSVQAPNIIAATVPSGATTGKITVTTPNGTATSKVKFTVK